MLKSGKKRNGDGNFMNKYDYDNITSKIKILEIKFKRIQFQKKYLNVLRPSFLMISDWKNWQLKCDLLIQEEQMITDSLCQSYFELENFFMEKKKKQKD